MQLPTKRATAMAIIRPTMSRNMSLGHGVKGPHTWRSARLYPEYFDVYVTSMFGMFAVTCNHLQAAVPWYVLVRG